MFVAIRAHVQADISKDAGWGSCVLKGEGVMVAPYLGDCFVQTILSCSCLQAYVHCVKGAGALPGLGPAEPGQEPCDTTMHMD